MIIKNNTPKEKTLYYKVEGKIFHVVIPAYGQSADIEAITHIDQLQLSTYERRLRHIETHFGKSFSNPFSVPGDSEFPGFRLTASVIGNYPGTLTPASISISEGDNATFTLVLPPSSRTITIIESTPTLGTVTPNGSTVVTSVPSLSTFTDNEISKMSALTYVASGTSAYTITNMASAHTLQASFDVTTTAKTFSMTSAAVQIPITASVVSGGTMTTASGQTSATTMTYLSGITFNGNSFLNSVTGTLSGSSSCAISGITAYTNTLYITYGYVPTATTITMSASTNEQTPLRVFTVNGVDRIGAVTGAVSGESFYSLVMTSTTAQVVSARFYSGI